MDSIAYSLISAVSLAFGVYLGLHSLKRYERIDTKNEASQLTTVIIKLENISAGIAEIKSEMSNVKCDIKEDRERLIIVEESTKSAHKRIDGMQAKI